MLFFCHAANALKVFLNNTHYHMRDVLALGMPVSGYRASFFILCKPRQGLILMLPYACLSVC